MMADFQYDDDDDERNDPTWIPSPDEESDDDEIDEKDIRMEVHHFATNKHKKYTPMFNAIVNPHGLGLDERWNKEKMLHHGRHTEAYHKYVYNSMIEINRKAHNQSDFLTGFEGVKKFIIKNPQMLYKPR